MPAVAYDNQASITGSGVTSLDTGAFTITSNSNRAAIVGCAADNGSAFSYTVGGVAASGQIPGCFSFNILTSVVTAPPSGSQTAHAQWTTAANVVLGVMTFYNVKQATPTNNGTNAATVGTAASVTITSTSGDLTVDHLFTTGGALSAPTQNLGFNTANGTLAAGGGTYGPGTGTTTHAWTLSAGSGTSDGVNLVQADDLMGQAIL
jgi:hypothetical protein